MTENNANEPLAFTTFLMRWNAEIVSLYSKRLQECSMLPFNMMLCGSPDDLADLQDRFGANLKADYAAAAEKLSGLACQRRAEGGEPTESYASIILAAQEDARAIIAQARDQARRILEQSEQQASGQAGKERESAAA